MKQIVCLWCILVSGLLQAQEVHLQLLLDSAQTHYPTYQNYELQQALGVSKSDQIRKQNLPVVQLKGKASWQSEVIELPINLPGVDIPSMSKDQYQATLEVQQAIYQGGMNKAQQDMERVDQQIRRLETTSSLYQVKQRVATLFFQTLLVQQQLEVLDLHRQTLTARKQELGALLKEGMVLQQSVDYLSAELIGIDQQKKSLESQMVNYLKELESLSGQSLRAEDEFVLPQVSIAPQAENQRHELEMMKLQIAKMEVGQQMARVQNRPMVFAYATAGYGRPGLNYLSDEFSDFYMMGLQFQWKIWDWQDQKARVQQLRIQQDMVSVEEATFRKEVDVAAQKMLEDMSLIDSLKVQDKELIRLREAIAETSAQQVKSGTLTASSYIEEMNRLKQARLNARVHDVQYALAQVNYLWIKGLL